jgi:S1-C subfamily serine protease
MKKKSKHKKSNFFRDLKKKLSKKVHQCKEYLKDQLFYAKELGSKATNSLFLCMKLTALGCTIVFASFISGNLHSAYIESKVGSETVFIRSPEGARIQGSGTGFEIKAPSGKTYTLTNAHVCGLAKDGIVLVGEKKFSERLLPKRVIEVYEDNDLCLVEGLEGYSGLTLASNSDVGDLVWAIGYPLGQGLNISSGRIKGYGNIDVADPETPLEDCKGPHKHVETFNYFFMSQQVCVETREAVHVDVPTFPGNSGSPLVNVYGNVEGIIFASSGDTHWGEAVGLDDINKFLRPY